MAQNSDEVRTWWRMPSSSRAYPMKIEKKADHYKVVFGM